jgi:hypothetical protein
MLSHARSGGKAHAHAGSDIRISARPGGEISPAQIVGQRLIDSLPPLSHGSRQQPRIDHKAHCLYPPLECRLSDVELSIIVQGVSPYLRHPLARVLVRRRPQVMISVTASR